jgi:hypothetical protein
LVKKFPNPEAARKSYTLPVEMKGAVDREMVCLNGMYSGIGSIVQVEGTFIVHVDGTFIVQVERIIPMD